MGGLNIFDGSEWKPVGVVINNYNIPPASVGLAELNPEVTAEALGGATPPVLLWENASPTSQFAAQTIALDLSAYEFFLVEFRDWPNDGNYVSVLASKNKTFIVYYNTSPVGGGTNAMRRFTPSDTGISFSENYNGGTVRNDGLVPGAIYGIKGVN